MILEKYVKYNWIEAEPTSPEEIKSLFGIVERDITDSKKDMSFDWQFGIAYNAALKLCTILLRYSGYRTKGGGNHHANTITIMPEILGEKYKGDSDYLHLCRRKRNLVEYDMVGGATKEDVQELHEFLEEFKKIVEQYISSF